MGNNVVQVEAKSGKTLKGWDDQCMMMVEYKLTLAAGFAQ